MKGIGMAGFEPTTSGTRNQRKAILLIFTFS